MNADTFDALARCVRAEVPVVLASVTATSVGTSETAPAPGASMLIVLHAAPLGSLGDPELDGAVAADARVALADGRRGSRRYPAGGVEDAVQVFFDVFVPRRKMVVLGAVDFTAALVKVAKVLGYRVSVCDARPAFATSARFPDADEVVVDWPHRYLAGLSPLDARDAVCVLTHDLKFDVPALVAALGSGAGYVGAMGSRRTQAGRLERLRAEGVSDADLARVMAPIGLDLGARTPEETAVAICAEIIAVHSGTPAASLRDGEGPIHKPPRR